jgi:hypothetical protein
MILCLGFIIQCRPCTGAESGFTVQGLASKVKVQLSIVYNGGFRVKGSGFRVKGSGFRVNGSGFRVKG